MSMFDLRDTFSDGGVADCTTYVRESLKLLF